MQLLTRAIRPPYPDAQELRRAQFELAQYEAGGTRRELLLGTRPIFCPFGSEFGWFAFFGGGGGGLNSRGVFG